MNSYFASVEQADRPKLRGRPVVVAAADVASTCCIAASYEAKRLGINTGTPVWEAKRHRGLHVVVARPDRYVDVHNQILKAIDTCVPVHAVHSIDEMSCRLSPAEREPDVARDLARRAESSGNGGGTGSAAPTCPSPLSAARPLATRTCCRRNFGRKRARRRYSQN